MTVHMNTLSRLLAAESVSRIDSLKIDIEGYEDRALLPYFQSTPVEYWPAAIVIEHAHPESWNKDCLSELARLGYKVVRRIGLNTLLERTPAVCAASREQVASIPGDDGTSWRPSSQRIWRLEWRSVRPRSGTNERIECESTRNWHEPRDDETKPLSAP
jgi:hypothetical protein